MIMKRFRSGTLVLKPTWCTATIHKDEHTHTKKVESSGRQNGHRHPTLYFILVSILQDAKYIIIMLYSRWRPIHQSVNWCGWLYTRPGFTEKWSKAWEQKQMKSVYMRVVSVHLSDLRQGYLCKRKITDGSPVQPYTLKMDGDAHSSEFKKKERKCLSIL